MFRTITTVKDIGDTQHLIMDEFKEALGSFDLTEDELNNCEVEGEIVHIKDGEVNLKTLEVLGKGELNSEMLKNLGPLPGYNEETAKFKKVKDGIIEKDSLGDALKQFSEKSLKAGSGELSPSAKGVGALFENLSKVYRSEIVLKSDRKGVANKKLKLSDYEAPIHGFVYGTLAMNFKYEYALRIRAEQAAGKGFVDLVVGSHGREFRIELKGLRNTAQDAKRQSEREGYDKAPIIYSFGEEQKAKTVTMVFSNIGLDPSSGGLLVEESEVSSKPEGLIELFNEHSDESLKEKLKEKLNYLYYSISDSNGGGKNTNYLSRLILGELLADNTLEKRVFIYEGNHIKPGSAEHGTRSGQVPEDVSTEISKMVSTFLFKKQGGKYVVLNVIEGENFEIDKNIPLDGIELSKCTQVNIKVNPKANGGFEVESDPWKSYYQGIEIGGVTSFGNKYEGKLEKIKHIVLQDITDITQVRGFQEALFPLRKLITLENHFQAIVQGLLSAQEGVEVLTEPNYSSKGKPDLLVSRREKDGRTHVAVVELKLAKTEEEIEKRRKEGEDQLKKRADGLETITKEEKVEAAVLVVCPSVKEDKFITFKREGDLNVGHSSRGSSDGEPSPKRRSCLSDRRKRNIGMSCVDSRDEEGIEERDRKEKLVSELFDRDKIREIKENFEFYNQLFEISDQISKGGTINEDARKALKAKVKDIDLNLIDPEIKGIVAEIKNKISQENANKGLEAILRESGVAEKIGKVAEGAGLAFTVFSVGKHIANGNIEGLGYDALNLLIMPKIGEKISGKILELGTKLDSQMLKGFAPVMGRAIGNFAAFLGLAESIKARQSATDPVDMRIADLNIATNSIFIAADVPAVVTETMSVAGLETGVVGEFAGPVGVAVSVAVIIISQFVEAELEVQKLEEQINLTDQEKHDLYWDFFLGMKMPEYIEHDIEAKKNIRALYIKYYR
ncbi:MAG: PD-(D/E)XK nuclease domain-containing protein [Wolbachia endosymbiont of Tetragnatha montana]|nr:PD-(D/E)XK nuclease domain-containing protein [Wolbachia endosymbiont of Tetragnatha montana]